jgi:two-component system sensor histidine kinase ChvG
LDAELSRDQPRIVDLGRLIHDIVALYQATARPGDVRVQFEPHSGLDAATVMGREGPLGQILRNLIDNARSFSPPGDVVTVGLLRVKGEVIATVSDNGPGIPAENLETVFERFYTSRPKGAAFGGNSGLGLSIARQIAEAHGGHLRAENRTGAEGKVLGALFILTLPDALP